MPGRTSIPLSTKIEILKELEKPGASLKIVADKFKIGKTTVCDIKKQRESFNDPNLSNNKDRKRKQDGRFGEIEEALFICHWFLWLLGKQNNKLLLPILMI